MVSHGRKLAKLNRDLPHRMAMLRNMVTSLIKHERIQTTHAKAKAAQRMADRMIGYAKDARAGNLHSRRKVQAFMREVGATNRLYQVLAPRYQYRPCGFTRVLHLKNRMGDNAPISVLEFVDRKGELRPAAECGKEYFLAHQIIARMREENQKKYRL
jgi:large subunit ribosomal protein L17